MLFRRYKAQGGELRKLVSCISKKLSVSYSHEEKQQGQTNTKQIFAKPTALEAFKGVELS